jgi:hypothetical protein
MAMLSYVGSVHIALSGKVAQKLAVESGDF